jgi:hypothetical protein
MLAGGGDGNVVACEAANVRYGSCVTSIAGEALT